MIGYFLLGRERRSSFSVHEPPNPSADRVNRAEALEFVKDGFVFPAFVLPPVWLAARGIWLGTMAYLAAAGVIAAVALLFDLSSVWPALALLAVHLIFGAEADELYRSHLEAKGWTTVGHVTGTGALDCERRFYDQWLPAAPMTRASQPVNAAATSISQTPPTASRATSPATPLPIPPLRTQPAGVLGNLLAPLRRGK